ncbi:Hypothetical Protein FCC1311_078722 [Hondaea fermentalgiana]|uniref:CWH43-like N-terminal domain-containing protein n=1 Tax=Hondaea fermentalgiana TaxID=2315210 RepID=A0A2R5GL89_9STRA|nr:Hypothetical Protein FCC1311_078722 [Hondaea fermentalgiana]|eukprot:GBG31647.1 Hypothetical Protein FCC1311_078722 [Hondaea fermentalgiana]
MLADEGTPSSTMSPGVWKARTAMAAIASGLIFISYVTCIAIAIASDTYIGGLSFPYFSDTGRDKPAYYIFATLNTVASVCMFPFMIMQYYYVQAWVPGGEVKCRNITATIFGCIAPIGSILLSIFDTGNYSALHSYSAYVFFILIILHCSFSIAICRFLAARFPETHGGCLIISRYIVMATLTVGFIGYIPVGLALACEWTRLPLDDCITIVGDEEYCTDKIYESNATLTTLFAYDNCTEVNDMRAVTQFISIVSLLAYIFLYALDPAPQQHSSMVSLWTVRAALAGAGASLIVLAYVTCICIAASRNTYVGGLTLPYFSDTGRDKPAYYVFASFITAASVLFIGFHVLQFVYVLNWIPGSEVKCRNIAASVLGVVAAIASTLLSIFDTSKHEALHAYSAYVFFVFVVGHACVSISIYRTLRPQHERFAKLMLPRYITLGLLMIAFIIYIPVGLGLVCSWSRLPMDECIDEVGDVDYCESNALPEDPTLTLLWSYDECSAVNEMRAAAQFVCIVSLMVFIAMYSFDPHPCNPRDVSNAKDDPGNATTGKLAGTVSEDVTLG